MSLAGVDRFLGKFDELGVCCINLVDGLPGSQVILFGTEKSLSERKASWRGNY
jgi:hypothetical protein